MSKKLIIPDYHVVSDYWTFNGATLAEALRKAADYCEQQDFDPQICPVISASFNEDLAVNVSGGGDFIAGSSISILKVKDP